MLRNALIATLVLAASLAGCASPAVTESQRVQMAALAQYRAEMAAYHEKVRAHLEAEKRERLASALEASLARAADDAGRVPLEAVLEKVRKRDALAADFHSNLVRLDAEFAERQALAERALVLGRETLSLMESWSRLGTLLRSLFVRELEAQALVQTTDREKEPDR